MGDIIQKHPDISSGYIDKFGVYKVERQTKTVIKNILTKFFDKNSNLYEFTAPEIEEIQNTESDPKVFIEKEFPFYERKLPCIVILSGTKQEVKPFIGGDDYVYSDIVRDTSTGLILTEERMYANMYTLPLILGIAANSVEQRMQLCELVSLCFTHYYRWVYVYKDIDGSLFNIVPNKDKITITSEREAQDKAASAMIYTSVIGMTSLVEYIFKDIGDNYDLTFITGAEVGETVTTSTGEEYGLGIDPVNYSLQWE